MTPGQQRPGVISLCTPQGSTPLQQLLPHRQLQPDGGAGAGTVSGTVGDGTLLAAVVVSPPETSHAHQARTVSAASSAVRTGDARPRFSRNVVPAVLRGVNAPLLQFRYQVVHDVVQAGGDQPR